MRGKVPWGDCPECVAHESFSLGLAVASVGIEQGVSAAEMARIYFVAYHRSDHGNDPGASHLYPRGANA